MKFLIAPDKFKGCLTAGEAAAAMALGVRDAAPDVELDLCPMADGGEGTVSAMLAACGGRIITRRVTGPLPEMKVDASFAMLGDGTTAVIEMAAASGLALLPIKDRNPLHTTTFGTGELIAAAVREGAKKIILGLGGSATIDAGIGCAQACGFTILMRDGEPTSMSEPLCGRDISNVLMVKHGRGEVTSGMEILAAVDVKNPLFGPDGASMIFGPQKGANPAVVHQLDGSLRELAGRNQLLAEAQILGAGAAGGMGFGVLAFFRGRLQSGFDLIAGAVGLDDRLSGSALCITGEGCLDSQSVHGKVVAGVGGLCKLGKIPCVALVGRHQTNPSLLEKCGITACFSICDGPISMARAMANAADLLRQSARNSVNLWLSRARPD